MTIHILILLALFVSGVEATTTWTPVESDLWIPVAPDGIAERDRIRFEGSEAFERGIWSRMAPGDTLAFAVRGDGVLRVETRPTFRTNAPVRRYRLGVRVGTGDLRRLVRRSDAEGRAVFAGDSLRTGEIDRWETSLDDDPDGVRVFLREERSAPVLIRVLARGRVEVPRAIESTDPAAVVASTPRRTWGLTLEAPSVGYDDNANLAPADSTRESTWFVPVKLGLNWDPIETDRLELEFDYDFETLQYDTKTFDFTSHRVQARQTLAGRRWDGLGPTRVRFEQRFRSQDKTFFGRGSFEEFETGPAGLPVGLGDRFDWVEGRARVRTDHRVARDVELLTEIFVLRRDYTQDYTDDPDVDSLDQWRVGGEAGAAWKFVPDWSIEAEVGFQSWSYDEKFSRDASGIEIPSLATRLHRWPLRLRVERDPGAGLHLGAGIGWLLTRDRRAGWWDRDTLIADAEAEWRSGSRWRFGGRLRTSATDYANATFDGPTGPELRTKSSLRASLEGRWEWTDAIRTEVEFLVEERDNDLPKFAYRRDRLFVTLRIDY